MGIGLIGSETSDQVGPLLGLLAGLLNLTTHQAYLPYPWPVKVATKSRRGPKLSALPTITVAAVALGVGVPLPHRPVLEEVGNVALQLRLVALDGEQVLPASL